MRVSSTQIHAMEKKRYSFYFISNVCFLKKLHLFRKDLNKLDFETCLKAVVRLAISLRKANWQGLKHCESGIRKDMF